MKYLTIGLLSQKWNTPGPRKAWQVCARKAVDNTFKEVAKDHCITRWKPVRFSPNYLKQTDFGTPKLERFVRDALEEAFWEQDTGWSTVAEAYDNIAKVLHLQPDPKVEEDEVLAILYDKFGTAWNQYQREYAMQRYGIDINFGN